MGGGGWAGRSIAGALINQSTKSTKSTKSSKSSDCLICCVRACLHACQSNGLSTCRAVLSLAVHGSPPQPPHICDFLLCHAATLRPWPVAHGTATLRPSRPPWVPKTLSAITSTRLQRVGTPG